MLIDNHFKTICGPGRNECYSCRVYWVPSITFVPLFISLSVVPQVPYTIVRYPFYMENFFKIMPPQKQDDGSFAISKGLFTSMKSKRESENDFVLKMGFESILFSLSVAVNGPYGVLWSFKLHNPKVYLMALRALLLL